MPCIKFSCVMCKCHSCVLLIYSDYVLITNVGDKSSLKYLTDISQMNLTYIRKVKHASLGIHLSHFRGYTLKN